MIRFITAAGSGVAATVVQFDLTGISNGHRVGIVLMTVVPFAAVYWWLELRARKATAPAVPPQRPLYMPGRPRGRG